MSPITLTNGHLEEDLNHHSLPSTTTETLISTSTLPHSHYSFSTRALHIGSEPENSSSGSVIPSLELGTTYEQSKIGQLKAGFEYIRSSNPTRLALERLLASIEGADLLLEKNLLDQGLPSNSSIEPAALAFSSGSAATATIVSGLGGLNGHIISVADVYGGTSRYLTQVANLQQGITTSFIDMSYKKESELEQVGEVDGIESEEERKERYEKEDDEIIKRIEDAILPQTKAIWIETPSNPTLNIVPIGLISKIAKKHSIPFIVDNTFASSYYQNPLALGADVVVHSITKYLNGHSDVCGGAIITPSPHLLKKFRFLQNAHGAILSPFDSWLTIRGLKTLSLRSREHGLNALLIANWLERVGRKEGLIRDVRYPGLKRLNETKGERRERELSWEQLSEGSKKWMMKLGYTRDGEKGFPFSGMISFHINSGEEGKASQTETKVAEKFLEGLHLFALAESLGGVESLVELPLLMTHSGIPIARRIELGLDGELVRISVGVEDGEDLLADIERSLRAAVSQ